MHLRLFFFTLHIFNFFLSRNTYTITSLTFQVSSMDLTAFLAQLVPILIKSKVKRGKICFLIFGHFFSKCTFLRLWHFFLAYCLSNQLNFLVVVHIYKIRVFNEVFLLLTIRMPMITKLFRVVICWKELSPKYTHDIERSGLVGSRDK